MTEPRLPPPASLRFAGTVLAALLLASCAGQHPRPAPPAKPADASAGKPARKPWKPLGPYTPGGLYAPGVSDGAPDVPPDVAKLPEPVPHPEPLSRYGNRSPYSVLGKSYSVLPSAAGYVERGMASWYGTKFDGRVTSSFEPYDLSQFTAAHKTLPLPSYARVTNLENGRSVIVRINDRGPFHEGRLIDLSYAAAIKLGVNVHGTAMVEVRGIDTGRPLPASNDDGDAIAAQPATPRPAPARPRPVAVAKPPVAKPLAASPPTTATAAADAGGSASPAAAPPPAAGAATALAGDASTTLPANTAATASPASTLPLPPPAAAAPVVALPATPPPAGTPAAPASASATVAPSASAALPPATLAAPPSAAPRSAAVASITPPPARPALPAATPALAPGHPPVDPDTLGFLQLASFGDRTNADRLMQRLQQAGIEKAELVSVQVAGQTLWRVHIGPMKALEADGVAARLDELGFGTPPFFKE